MAWEGPQYGKQSRVANSNLSTKKYHFVKLVTGGDGDLVDICDGVTDVPFGILQNSPLAGQEAEICVAGFSKVVGGASGLAIGDQVGTSATGRAAKQTIGTDTTHYVVGTLVLAPSADGNIGTVHLSGAPHRAA